MNKKQIIEKKTAALTQRLPVLDGTLDQLLTGEDPEKVQKTEWMDLLKRDPGLCVQFLALANSPCFGGDSKHPAGTMEQAWELSRKWRFPDSMRDGILRHHSPLIHTDFSYPGAVIFAAHFVTMSDFTGEIIAEMLGSKFLDRLEVNHRDLERAQHLFALTLN